MDIASFVGATTSTHDVTMVHKFPNKLVHSFNKLSFNKATVFHLAILVLRFTGSIDLAVIITKFWTNPEYFVSVQRYGMQKNIFSLKCLLGSTTQPKAAVSVMHTMQNPQKDKLLVVHF